jgi:serralysin
MAEQNDDVAGSGYGNVYIDSLIWGCGWSGDTIYVAFGTGLNSYNYIGYEWTHEEITAFNRAFDAYEAVCNISFTVVNDLDAADMLLWTVDSDDIGATTLGMFDVPDEAYPQTDGMFNWEYEGWQYLRAGGDGFQTIIHELGHGLGLAHPHDGGGESDATLFPGVTDSEDTGTYDLNQGIWTTMSYITDWTTGQPATGLDHGHAATPMALDIAALQALYGVNTSYRTGADTYFLPERNVEGTGWTCIWDAGGTDTISAIRASRESVIDLRDAPLVGPDAGGYVSWSVGIRGGFTIAANAVIENAVGSDFADLIAGNEARNSLRGRGGDDEFYGFKGNDRIIGGKGNDWINGGTGRDDLTGGDGVDRFIFNAAIRSGNVDVIQDFDTANDRIWLSRDVFGNLPKGVLRESAFDANATGRASDESDRIIYDETSGRLYFDRDGTGDAQARLFAELDRGLDLRHSDFLLVF